MVKCLKDCARKSVRWERFETVKIDVLGSSVDGLALEQFVERISTCIEKKEPCFVITLNPELLYRAQHERDLLAMINRADLVTPDGVGIVWACRTAGHPVPGRVTGIDLMMRLLELAGVKGWRVFFLGSAPGVAEAAAQKAAALFPGLRVAGTFHGYFPEKEGADVAGMVAGSSPDLLFVALGSPRQEKWIDENINLLGNVAAIGVGGSLDVLSGNVRRVPGWLRRLNLEWLGRLFMEPRRWRRMLVLPKFAVLVLKGKYMKWCNC
ncbi:MAG: WecB/TagA/CpsF family glycosyltransferase [Bacillota bacterium]